MDDPDAARKEGDFPETSVRAALSAAAAGGICAEREGSFPIAYAGALGLATLSARLADCGASGCTAEDEAKRPRSAHV